MTFNQIYEIGLTLSPYHFLLLMASIIIIIFWSLIIYSILFDGLETY